MLVRLAGVQNEERINPAEIINFFVEPESTLKIVVIFRGPWKSYVWFETEHARNQALLELDKLTNNEPPA